MDKLTKEDYEYGFALLGASDVMKEQAARIAQLETALAAAQAENKGLRTVIRLLLDHVDYTAGACGLTEMVGGALPYQILDRAKAALAAK